MSEDHVEAYAGSSYPERPTAFTYAGEHFTVDLLIHRWRFPSGPGFRVRTTTRQVFELLYREDDDRWEIIPITDDH